MNHIREDDELNKSTPSWSFPNLTAVFRKGGMVYQIKKKNPHEKGYLDMAVAHKSVLFLNCVRKVNRQN